MSPARKSTTAPLDEYNAAAVTSLSDREAVRLRPGMYIGGKDDRALNHIAAEIVDNSIDEFMGGYCTDVWVEVAADQTVIIRDNGRGMPLGEKHARDAAGKETGQMIPTPQMLVTKLHAGGKFGQAGGYDLSGGLHGVGLKAGNFCSKRFVVDVWRDGQHYHQEFSNGAGIINAPVIEAYKGDLRGTQITYRFDETVFADGTHVDAERLVSKLRDASYPCAGLSLHFKDARTGVSETFKSTHGIVDLIDRMVEDTSPIAGWRAPIRFEKRIDLEKGDPRSWVKDGKATFIIDVALLPTDDTNPLERTMAYSNTIPNPDGGDHLSGVKAGIARAVKAYMIKNALTKSADTLDSADILGGMALVVSVRMTDPMFASQHKTKLAVSEIGPLSGATVVEWLADWLDTNEKPAKAWARSIEAAREARLEFVKTKKLSRERGRQNINSLLAKLVPPEHGCPPEKAELFLVEGDSAGGSAKGARDKRYQGILPCKGKGQNVWNVKKVSDLLDNQELATISASIGIEFREPYDVANLKFHKIIMLADADADGGHIALLWLSIFWREFRPLLEGGHIYVGLPPLYSAKPTRGRDRTKTYLADDRAKDLFMKGKSGSDYEIKRFKGLGEMDVADLRVAVLHPATRRIVQVTLGEAQAAHEMLSGVMLSGKENSLFRHDYLRRGGRADSADLLQSA